MKVQAAPIKETMITHIKLFSDARSIVYSERRVDQEENRLIYGTKEFLKCFRETTRKDLVLNYFTLHLVLVELNVLKRSM